MLTQSVHSSHDFFFSPDTNHNFFIAMARLTHVDSRNLEYSTLSLLILSVLQMPFMSEFKIDATFLQAGCQDMCIPHPSSRGQFLGDCFHDDASRPRSLHFLSESFSCQRSSTLWKFWPPAKIHLVIFAHCTAMLAGVLMASKVNMLSAHRVLLDHHIRPYSHSQPQRTIWACKTPAFLNLPHNCSQIPHPVHRIHHSIAQCGTEATSRAANCIAI